MRRVFSLLVLLGGLASPALAQDDPATREALAERYVEATVRDGMSKVLDELLDEELRVTELPQEQAAWMQANVPTILRTHLEPMIDDMEQAYADGLTEQELQALVDFYETPMGQTLALKQFKIGSRQGEQFVAFMTNYLTDLATKFCAEFDCPAGTLDAVSPAKN
jgi:hypothetical protein